RLDSAAVPSGVFVLEGALQHVGDGLESSVGVIGCADGLTRAVVGGTHLVEQEEGVDVVDVHAGEGPADDEAPAFPLAVGADDARHLTDAVAHGRLLCVEYDAPRRPVLPGRSPLVR